MEENDTAFTFDYEGRLLGAYLDGRNYRRSLANLVLEKSNGASPGLAHRVRQYLDKQKVQLLEIRAYEFAQGLAEQIKGEDAMAEAGAALARVGHYSYGALEHEREAYEKIYKPVTILPPDQYLALYLQATEGCTYNACSFCGFYRDRKFHIKSVEEFRQHILALRRFFGGGLSLRRSIFLGDANALMIPQQTLRAMFDEINHQFSILPGEATPRAEKERQAGPSSYFNGIYSFIDAFSTRRKTVEDFRELHGRGLRRVYLGLESGDPELLRFMGKPHSVEDVEQLVANLKRAEVAVGLVILVGAGGNKYQDAHIAGTVKLVNSLPLDQRDLIYFSELIDYPGSAYGELAQRSGIRPSTMGEIEHQIAEMRAGFRFHEQAPKISFYDIREFVY
jgi:radical SAM superfamily enzyme YgiQ (UPF0313 family)